MQAIGKLVLDLDNKIRTLIKNCLRIKDSGLVGIIKGIDKSLMPLDLGFKELIGFQLLGRIDMLEESGVN